MELYIIKESPGWIAISKPASIQVERNPFGPSAESLVYAHLKKEKRVPYVGIVHRLDRVTTGLVLLAKKKSVLKELNEQFRIKEVGKTYLAMVEKAPSFTEETLSHWLAKDLHAKRAKVVGKNTEKASECVLSYRTLHTDEKGRALLEVKPVTGKYHQIRAQLAAIGCPVVGDLHYGAKEEYQPDSIMLHAWKLEFFDVDSRQRVELEAPLPDWAKSAFPG